MFDTLTGNVSYSDSLDEARAYLNDLWTDRDGRTTCPACGSLAQDWYQTAGCLTIICEDCGREDRRYFQQ